MIGNRQSETGGKRREVLDWNAIGQRIGRGIRTRYGSVARFCGRLGLSSAAVYRNVNGVQKPGLDSLLLYRESLGCSLDTLLGRIQPNPDSGAAWRESVGRIRKFRRRWSLEDRFRIACLVSGMMPGEAELELQNKYLAPGLCGSEKGLTNGKHQPESEQ